MPPKCADFRAHSLLLGVSKSGKIPQTSAKLLIALAALCNEEHTEFLYLSRPSLTLSCWALAAQTCIPQPMEGRTCLQSPNLSSGKGKQIVMCIVGMAAREVSEINGTWGKPKFHPWGKGLGMHKALSQHWLLQAISGHLNLALWITKTLKKGWLWQVEIKAMQSSPLISLWSFQAAQGHYFLLILFPR